MSTTVRPHLADSNIYQIPTQRYYELYHFCLQYPDWKQELSRLSELKGHACNIQPGEEDRPLEDFVIKKDKFQAKIALVEKTAKQASPDLYSYLLKGVTKGYSYQYLRCMLGIPCNQHEYYEIRHRFFWLLDQNRY